VLGDWSNHPIDSFRVWYSSNTPGRGRFLLDWFLTYGALLDALCLILPLPVLAKLHHGSVPPRPRASCAVLICALQLFDLATSRRQRAGRTEMPWLSPHDVPLRIVLLWFRGDVGIGALVSRLGVSVLAGFVVQCVVLGHALTVLFLGTATKGGTKTGAQKETLPDSGSPKGGPKDRHGDFGTGS
jgi:hypothetical protein